MDGFAVRAADTAGAGDDTPVRLRVIATLMAGMAPDRAVGPGEAIRIMTGAPMPDGADAVVMVERSRPAGPDEVDLTEQVQPGMAVRGAGDDVQPGDEVVPAGTLLGPTHLGVLASVGLTEVLVVPRAAGRAAVHRRRARAAGRAPRASARSATRTGRCSSPSWRRPAPSRSTSAGCPTTRPCSRPACARARPRCDVLVTSGGVSMGEADVVKAVLGRIATMDWMQIAIRPAKPFALGRLDGTPILGLPGNPVSSFVSFELLARPALRRMAGRADLDRPLVRAVADADMRRRADGKTHFLRVRTAFDGTTGAGRPGRARRAATSSPPPRRPTAWPASPTGRAWPPAMRSTCSCWPLRPP